MFTSTTTKIAKGPNELSKALCEIKNSAMSGRIAYTCEALKADVCVTLGETVKITFEDVTFADKSIGRPAPTNVVKVIAEFLWEKCGEKERFLNRCTTSEAEAFVDWQQTEEFKNLFKDKTREIRRKNLEIMSNFGLSMHSMFSQSNSLTKDKILPGNYIHSSRKILK